MGTIPLQVSAIEIFRESSVPYRSVSPSSSGGTGGISPSATNSSDKRRKQSLGSRSSSSSNGSKFTTSSKMSENRPPSAVGRSGQSISSQRGKLSDRGNWPSEPPRGTFSTAHRTMQSEYAWQSPTLSKAPGPTPFLKSPLEPMNIFFISNTYGSGYDQPLSSFVAYDPPCSTEEWKASADRRRERRRLRKAYLSLSDQKMGNPQLPIDLFYTPNLTNKITLGISFNSDGPEPRRIKNCSSRDSPNCSDGKGDQTTSIRTGLQQAGNEENSDSRGCPPDLSEKGINLSKRKERKKLAYPDPYVLTRKLEAVRLSDHSG